MIITPKLLRDTQEDLIAGKLGKIDRKQVTDEAEPALIAIVGKKTITLYALVARGKKVKLGYLGETFDDQRTWVKTQRERAASLRSAAKQEKLLQTKKPGVPIHLGMPSDLTVAQYLDAYYYRETAGSIGVKNRSHKSQRMMRSAFASLLDKKMHEVNQSDISEWRKTYGQAVMREDGHSVKKHAVKDCTRRRNFTVFNAVFNHAAESKHIEYNPLLNGKGRPPKFVNDGSRVGRPLDDDELTRLLEVLNGGHPRDRVFCLMLILTGARPGELMSANLEWIEWGSMRMKVIAGKKQASEGEAREFRYLPIGSATKKMLLDYIRDQELGERGPLFRNYGPGKYWDKRMGEFRKPWKRISRNALITTRLYDLRHTYSSLIYDQKSDILSTSKLMGHADIKTTIIYLNRVEEKIVSATRIHDEMIFGMDEQLKNNRLREDVER